jgi:hypothetical protein
VEAGGSVAWLDDGWPGMIAASNQALVAQLRPFVTP